MSDSRRAWALKRGLPTRVAAVTESLRPEADCAARIDVMDAVGLKEPPMSGLRVLAEAAPSASAAPACSSAKTSCTAAAASATVMGGRSAWSSSARLARRSSSSASGAVPTTWAADTTTLGRALTVEVLGPLRLGRLKLNLLLLPAAAAAGACCSAEKSPPSSLNEP